MPSGTMAIFVAVDAVALEHVGDGARDRDDRRGAAVLPARADVVAAGENRHAARRRAERRSAIVASARESDCVRGVRVDDVDAGD